MRAIDAIYTLAPQIDFTVSFGKTAAIMAASVAANAVLVALIVTRAPSLFHLPQFLPPAGAAVAQSSPPLRPSPRGFPQDSLGSSTRVTLNPSLRATALQAPARSSFAQSPLRR